MRVALAAVFALLLAACGALAPGDPVDLLTGSPLEGGGCFTNSASGPLVVDAVYGTAIIDGDVRATTPVPVMWGAGFTGRRVDGAVVVFNQLGTEVARTGRSYRIEGGYVGPESALPGVAVGAFLACGFVRPE